MGSIYSINMKIFKCHCSSAESPPLGHKNRNYMFILKWNLSDIGFIAWGTLNDHYIPICHHLFILIICIFIAV